MKQEFKPGQIIKWKEPEIGEENQRFEVVECLDGFVYIRLKKEKIEFSSIFQFKSELFCIAEK